MTSMSTRAIVIDHALPDMLTALLCSVARRFGVLAAVCHRHVFTVLMHARPGTATVNSTSPSDSGNLSIYSIPTAYTMLLSRHW